MNQEPRIRYTRVRKVKDLVRANDGDAGLDFFFPEDITLKELMEKQSDLMKYGITFYLEDLDTKDSTQYVMGDNKVYRPNIGYYSITPENLYDLYKKRVVGISLKPQLRVLIPSGIRVLLEPKSSMLMAANKSGIATKTGLIFGAEIVDSPYTGEVHVSLINTSSNVVILKAGEKLVQFIHVPIYQTEPEEIPNGLYEEIAKGWGTRGDKGFGSSDKISEELKLPLDYTVRMNYEDELNIRSY